MVFGDCPDWALCGLGVGLDFSAASVVVFAELPADAALVRQAEDRAHRKGLQHPVNVYFLIANATSDDRRCLPYYCQTPTTGNRMPLGIPLNVCALKHSLYLCDTASWPR